jgi:hypothetical protein
MQHNPFAYLGGVYMNEVRSYDVDFLSVWKLRTSLGVLGM